MTRKACCFRDWHWVGERTRHTHFLMFHGHKIREHFRSYSSISCEPGASPEGVQTSTSASQALGPWPR